METIKKIAKWTVMIITVIAWVVFIGGADSILEQKMMFPTVLVVSFISFLCYLVWKEEFDEKGE